MEVETKCGRMRRRGMQDLVSEGCVRRMAKRHREVGCDAEEVVRICKKNKINLLFPENLLERV